jgi:hypothetical protein
MKIVHFILKKCFCFILQNIFYKSKFHEIEENYLIFEIYLIINLEKILKFIVNCN